MKFTEKFKVVQGIGIDEINEHIIAHGNGIRKDYFVSLLSDEDRGIFDDVKEDYVFLNCKYNAVMTFDEVGFTVKYFQLRYLKFKSKEVEEFFKSIKDEYIELEIDIKDMTETGDINLVREQLSKLNTIRFIGGKETKVFEHIKYLKDINVDYPGKDSGFSIEMHRSDSQLLIMPHFIYEGLTIAILTLSEDLIPSVVGNIQDDIEKRLITVSRTK